MTAVTRIGRPPRTLVAERTRRFLELVTAGEHLDEARRLAGLTKQRAWNLLADLGPEGIAALIVDRGDEEWAA